MKHTLRIPTKEAYAYIEAQFEGTPEEAVAEYERLSRLVKGGEGVGLKRLAEITHEYCTTGAIVNGGDDDLSTGESAFLNEIKKLIRNKNK